MLFTKGGGKDLQERKATVTYKATWGCTPFDKAFCHDNPSDRAHAARQLGRFGIIPSVTYEKLEITSNNLETSLSKHEEKHRTAMHSTDDTVLYEALFQCVDQGHVIDGIVSNHKKFNSCFQNIDRVMTREQLKRSDKRSLKEGGDKSVIARKLFGTPNNNIYKSKCSINNSQMELLNKNLDSADKDLYVDGKVDVSETVCDLQNESQRTLPTNDYNTQEFFDNLSFGTINEVFQATEILGSAESSPISNIHVESSAKVIQSNENYNQEEKKSKIGKAPNKKLILCRTSTPLNGFSKRNSSCKEITRKKIKFVADVENAHSHTSILDFKEVSSKESDCNFFPQELSKILSQDLTSTEMLQNTQNLTPSSKINAIKNIVSGSKSFVYVHNSNTSKSVITSNSVFNLADLLKEAQILEEGEMIGLKANSSSSEQKKRLENSSIEYSDSDFVSFSKLCKIDDSKAFETLGPCLKENLMIDRIDVHKLPVEHQDIIDDDKIMICDSSCEKNDKIDQGSLVLISSRSKRLRNESNDTSCEFDILKESGDIQDTAKRKCNSTTMFQSKKFLSMRQGEKIHSTCETVDSSECQKFNDVYKEDLVAGNVICWHDVKQHAPKLEMKNISIKIESNQSDTANMSLMDVTDTQLIAADENTNLLLHLTKNGRYSQWTNGFMKQGLHNGSENKVQKICEEYEQLLVQENGFSKQLCDVKDNSKECNSKNTIETIQNKTKVESHCLENNLEKSSSNHISCSENVENLLDSDTVDQLFEESTYFVERNNSKESVKIFPCKDDVAESKNENNTAKVILMETNISNNCIEGLSLVNPLMNYKQNYLKERNICLETAFRKPEPQNHRLASTSEKKLKISDTETVYMGVVKTLNCSENFTKKNENCSVSSESEFAEGPTKKADTPKDSGEEVSVCEEDIKNTQSHYSSESMPETAVVNNGLFISSGEKGNASKIIMKKVKPLSSESSVLESGPMSCGFTTASGKKIKISEEAMQTARLLLSEENTLEPIEAYVGLCLAGGKEGYFSEQATTVEPYFSEESILKLKFENCEFSTPSRKKVYVSEDTMKQAKSIFAEESTLEVSSEIDRFFIASEKNVDAAMQSVKKATVFFSGESVLMPEVTNCGFSTASGKKVGVSEEALKKAKLFLSEESVLEPRIPNCVFSTASGKKVDVSEEALKKAKLFLCEESVLEPRIPNCGFSTASGKKVDVSEQAMKKAKSLFSEESMLEMSSENCGFSTASGKKVGVSEEALKKAKLFLSEESVLEPRIPNCGFSTASGKKVDVSEQAMKKAKSLFSEESMLEMSSENCGFSTASGKKVGVSEEALKKAKLFLSEESVLEPRVPNCGFSTASGKKVDVSEQAMKKAKSLFSEESMLEMSSENCGFSTASGKKVGVSEEALKKAKLFLSEESVLEPRVPNCGFSTASGKKVDVSEQAMKKAKSLFSEESMLEMSSENCGFSTASGKKVGVSEEALKKAKLFLSEESVLEPRVPNCGFSTASGKKVDVSEQAMKKAKSLFSEESMLEMSSENCGFSTASGKKVGVSEEALKKAKLFLSEESVLEPRVPNCGFSTASGKKVDVSEQAMKKAKSLFSEESMLEMSSENCGFSTASGKKVGVSEEALKKAKLFLSEESVLEPRVPNCGFSTASGKKVDVSEQAMKKAKSLFSEESLSELCSKNDRFSKTKLKNVDTCEQDMKKLEVFSKEMVLKSTVSSSCSSVAYEKKENIPEVTLEKVKSTFSKDEISEQVVCNFALSTVNTETVDVAKDLVLKNNSKLKLNNDSHAECNTEFNFGEAKNVNSLLLKYSLPVEDIKYCISGHKNRRRTHIDSNISSAVVCDAASVYDYSFGTEAMQSHSQSSSSQFKFDVDDNGLKSPVLQRNNLVITCEPSEIPIDTHSPPSPILKSNNSFISKKSQNLDIIYNNTTANFNLSRNQEVARNLFNEKVSDYCKPLCEKSKSVCKITEFVSEISLSQELTEQVTDILLDESSVPLWASSFVTCPDSSGDRFDAPKPVVSSDAGDVLPPVKFDLGCHDRFRTKQPCKSMYKSKLSLTSSKIQRLVSTSLCSNPNEQPSATKKVSFKVSVVSDI
ncbi:hypothetical protein PR048_021416 [Dryococelus australis]|uniref:Tower domain-containing protein n=1 Tax=Dryococelus australis TaxID=614101 RepID=A0ABQ9GY42_9NEOP|nr:hypothetical protein PR048_021416 [Dryococelus australis]